MPSCADFGVIEQYLSLREAVDSDEETVLGLSQEIPQFFSSSQDVAMDKAGQAIVASQSDLPLNFLDLETAGPLYLQELQSGPLPPRNPVTPVNLGGSNSQPSSLSSPFAFSLSPAPLPTAMTGKTYVAEAAGSGCTVLQSPDQQLSGMESPELIDLDNQSSFYADDFGLGVCDKPVKVEQMEDPMCDSLAGTSEALIESVRDDILQACTTLNISPDPSVWDHHETQRWVQHVCRKNSYSDDCAVFFNVRGDALCQMRKTEFQWRAPSQGQLIQQNVELWSMMARQTVPLSCLNPHNLGSPDAFFPESVTSQSNQPMAQQHCSRMPPSISPAPSTDSTCSTLSSSSGGHQSTFTLAQDSLDDDVFNSRRSSHPVTSQPSIPSSSSSSPLGSSPPRAVRHGKQTIHLWQFLKELLEEPETYHACIKWTDRPRGIFKIEDSSKVARLWGRRKNRPAMNYDKLSRSVRQYYKKGIIKKTEHSKRLVYQFCQPYL